MNKSQIKTAKRARRQARIRSAISGTSARPRLSVSKTNTALYLQIIDDTARKTLVAISTRTVKGKTPVESARAAGAELAKKALAQGVTAVVFDRGGNMYTGKVRAAAEGAREGGLTF